MAGIVINSRPDIRRLIYQYDFDQLFRVIETGEILDLGNLVFVFDPAAPEPVTVEAICI